MSKNIQIIVGSTRDNRVGGQIADWVKHYAEEYDGMNVEVVDLLEENLPFFKAATAPAYAPDPSEAGRAWAQKIARGDGYIFITPEYNRSVPASLKNALDFLVPEWKDKPAAIVSYGWVDGGASATRHLRDILGWLKVDTAETAVNLQLSGNIMAEAGGIKDAEDAFGGYVETLESALAEIVAHEPTAEPVAA